MTDQVIEMDERSMIASLAIQILTIPIPTDFLPDAIVTFGCMGEPWQISQAIQEWEQNKSAQYLLIGGLSLKERFYEEFTLERLRQPPYNLLRVEDVIHQVSAINTPDQMDWIIQQANNLGISSFLFFAPPYHMVRAYLTLLKSMLKADVQLVMLPRPLRVPPNIIVPEANASARDLIPDEIRKIVLYQDKGNVATLPELQEYLDKIYPLIIKS